MAEPSQALQRRAKRLLDVAPDLATTLRALALAVDEPDDAELVDALADKLEDEGPGDEDDDDLDDDEDDDDLDDDEDDDDEE